MEVKDILKNRRLELGLTLEDVARLVGVSAATVSRWETGDIANMRRDKIKKLADVLKISPVVIMGFDEEPTEEENYYLDPEVAEIAQQIKDNPGQRVLFDASRKLSKDDIEKVIQMIDIMIK